jgi:hypothetical protein
MPLLPLNLKKPFLSKKKTHMPSRCYYAPPDYPTAHNVLPVTITLHFFPAISTRSLPPDSLFLPVRTMQGKDVLAGHGLWDYGLGELALHCRGQDHE